jgi:hypothetical protein
LNSWIFFVLPLSKNILINNIELNICVLSLLCDVDQLKTELQFVSFHAMLTQNQLLKYWLILEFWLQEQETIQIRLTSAHHNWTNPMMLLYFVLCLHCTAAASDFEAGKSDCDGILPKGRKVNIFLFFDQSLFLWRYQKKVMHYHLHKTGGISLNSILLDRYRGAELHGAS